MEEAEFLLADMPGKTEKNRQRLGTLTLAQRGHGAHLDDRQPAGRPAIVDPL